MIIVDQQRRLLHLFVSNFLVFISCIHHYNLITHVFFFTSYVMGRGDGSTEKEDRGRKWRWIDSIKDDLREKGLSSEDSAV